MRSYRVNKRASDVLFIKSAALHAEQYTKTKLANYMQYYCSCALRITATTRHSAIHEHKHGTEEEEEKRKHINANVYVYARESASIKVQWFMMLGYVIYRDIPPHGTSTTFYAYMVALNF
jgi:hypothetical protein